MQYVFGAFAEPLHKQLDVPPSKTEWFQKYADAITLLNVGGILPDGEAHKARKRLVKKMEKELAE